ncbi:MAG: globin [Alphaproteobacteria bacterium]|nr:globin [Alphaproteobacteria bacterium]
MRDIEPIIAESLERASELGGDPTPRVYARLFADNPEMERLFVRDIDGGVRGNMLQQVFEALLDAVGEGAFGANLIRCEIVNHENLGVPPDVFWSFFPVVRDTIRDILGDKWTPAMESAWGTLLERVEAVVREQAA